MKRSRGWRLGLEVNPTSSLERKYEEATEEKMASVCAREALRVARLCGIIFRETGLHRYVIPVRQVGGNLLYRFSARLSSCLLAWPMVWLLCVG